MKTGTFQSTDATGIPALLTIADGVYHHPRGGSMPTLDVTMQKCGMDFGILVRFVDPDGLCPLVQVERPIGMDLVAELIAHVSGERSLPSTN